MNKSLKIVTSILALAFVAIFGFQNCSQKPLELNNINQSGTGTGSGGDGSGGGGISSGLSAGQASYNINEGAQLNIALSLSSPAESNYTVNWTIEPVGTGLVTADDFEAVSGSFSILVDQTGGSISLRARDNAQISSDKSYRVRITFTGSTQPLILGLIFKDNDSAQVYAGHVHTCLLKSGGLKCFGYNVLGQLGNGNATNQSTPVQVSGMDVGVQKAAVGINNTCAIKSGALYCWGSNNTGQLGKGTTDAQANSAPFLVPTMDAGVTDVTVGWTRVCAIKNGGAYCWGNGNYGTLGIGLANNPNAFSPTAVVGMGSGVTALETSDNNDGATAGLGHACAIKSGALYCWGYNGYGQLGDGTTANSNVPVMVSGMEADVTMLAVGGYSTCAVRRSNLYCWGYNGNGELGLGNTLSRSAPTLVPFFTGKRISQMDGGKQHFCATADGRVSCWGYNAFAQVGTGNTVNANAPVQLAGLDVGITSIACSGYGSFAIQNNRLMGWGRNSEGQLGRGNLIGPQTAPQVTFDLVNF